MKTIEQAKTLIQKAHDLRGSRAVFLRDIAEPIRKQINDLTFDVMLSDEGRRIKKQEIKAAATKEFMRKVSLRKQEYQHYLAKAKNLAEDTISKSFIIPDDSTRAKFNREFAELKFRMALKEERDALKEVTAFASQKKDESYSILLLENFYELAINFRENESKHTLAKTFNQLKYENTSVDVQQAYDIIEQAEEASKAKMFTIMMPGDNPSINVDYSIISELFTQDALRYYQDPEAYYAKNEDEETPVYVEPV